MTPELQSAERRRASHDCSLSQVAQRTLQTPYDQVYQHDERDHFYMMPASLRSVPIMRISEKHPYWLKTWDSLEEFLAKEDEEKKLKEHYQVLKNQNPRDKAICGRAKLHQDNMSKHVKIREIFGEGSPFHPNQLVSKRHIPVEGLCQKEIMYRVACKISDLQVLNQKGDLSMDAWDFIRWRIGLKLGELVSHPGEDGKGFVRTVIYKLCDGSKDDMARYQDPIMREAVRKSARYQGRLASYKERGEVERHAHAPTPADSVPRVRHHGGVSRNIIQKQTTGTTTGQFAHVTSETIEERRSRLGRVAHGTYQGVNAYREQRAMPKAG